MVPNVGRKDTLRAPCCGAFGPDFLLPGSIFDFILNLLGILYP